MKIQTKRVYEPPANDDGHRVLIDRVWPRGKKKADVKLDHWAKDLAPSTELRKWFNHDPDKWPEFKKRYFEELRQHKDQLHALLDEVDEVDDGTLTLLFGAKEERYNNAAAMRDYLNDVKGGRKGK